MGKSIAFFDFDGTITRKDTLLEFMKHVHGPLGAFRVFFLLLPSAILFALKFISNQEFKERYLKLAYKNMSETKLKKQAETFTEIRLPLLIRPKAIERIEWHRSQNHRIIIVSASFKLWLQPWCDKENLELICSRLEVKNGVLTGQIVGKNCRREEKVNQIRNTVNLADYEKTYAYGDSSGDREMLEFVDESHFRPFE